THGGGLCDRCGGVDLGSFVVTPLGFQEDDGVFGTDRLLGHPVGVLGVGHGDHTQTGGVHEVGLGRLTVVFHRADTAAVGDAHDQGHAERTRGTATHLRQLGECLV